MPVKRGSYKQSEGFVSSTVNTLTSAENRTIVTAVGLFAAGVVFLTSNWSEYLLPA